MPISQHSVTWVDDSVAVVSDTSAWTFPMHLHEGEEVILLLDGEASLETPQGEVQLQRGDLALLAPNEPHGGGCAQGRSARFFCIQFPRSKPLETPDGSGLLDLPIKKRVARTPRLLARVRHLLPRGGPTAEQLREAADLVIRRARAQQRLLRLRGELGNRPRDKLTEAWLLIAAGGAEYDDVSEIAARIGLNPSYFSTAFRRRFGLSPGQLILARRVDSALPRLLSPKPQSLAEIADACGFSDQAHFTRFFRRHYDTAPGAFRRANRVI
jgi:AraC-like DNA-binding protein